MVAGFLYTLVPNGATWAALGTFVPGPKNALVADLYRGLGFEQIAEVNGGATRWELCLSTPRKPLVTFVREQEVVRG